MTNPPSLIDPPRGRQTVLVGLLLVVCTLLAFSPLAGNGFINYDDPDYITDNHRVRTGLTPQNIRWAFTTGHASNWHPVTWLSHMLDADLFGLNAGGHHLTSLLLHCAGTLLLLAVLYKTTGDLWPSAVVAALFALHPLHVESVAWAAERKDVLSTFFGFAAVWRYTVYVSRPGVGTYCGVGVYFLLSLMSKPMFVTLPFVFLLLDYWPLARQRSDGGAGPMARRVLEKTPFFLMSAASSVVTFLVQRSGQAVMGLEALPVSVRLGNGVVAYVEYIRKMLFPADLGVFYPHPGMPAPWAFAGSALLLAAVTAGAVRLRHRHPYLLVGWLWYLGTLVPVIGIVQVGLQGMADRYTYVPLVGLFIAAAWGVPALFAPAGLPKPVLFVAAAALLTVFGVATRVQVGLWKDSIVLYEHTLQISGGSPKIHNNLGIALAERGQADQAAEHYLRALDIKPDDEHALINLANLLSGKGDTAQAEQLYRRALAVHPDSVQAHGNLAVMLMNRGERAAALDHFHKALRIDPAYAKGHYNLGNALAAEGRIAEALHHFRRAVGIDPLLAEAHNNLGVYLAEQGRFASALEHYRTAIAIRPEFAEAHNNLGIALFAVGRTREAADHFRGALAIDPSFREAAGNLKKVLLLKDPTPDSRR